MRNSEAIHWSRPSLGSHHAQPSYCQKCRIREFYCTALVLAWRLLGSPRQRNEAVRPCRVLRTVDPETDQRPVLPGIPRAGVQGTWTPRAEANVRALAQKGGPEPARPAWTALRACRGTRPAAASPPSCSCAGARQGTARSSCCQPRTGRPEGPPSGRTSTAGRPGPRSPGEARP